DCQALYYIAEGDWEIRMDGATILNLNQPNVQVFMGDELSTTDLGPRASSCVNTNGGVPWPYGACCRFCPTYEKGLWADGAHPSGATMVLGVADAYGRTLTDACGMQGATPSLAPQYVGLNRFEYFVR